MLSLRILAIESLKLGLKTSRQKALYSNYLYYTLKSNKNPYLFQIVFIIIFIYDTIAKRKDLFEITTIPITIGFAASAIFPAVSRLNNNKLY